MSELSHDRLIKLCEDLKLPGVAAGWSALATRAVEQGNSLMEFLEEVLIAARLPARPLHEPPDEHGGLSGGEDLAGL